MEQIVGRMHDEYRHDDDAEVVEVSEGDYLIEGSLSIDETVELIGFEPDEAHECETAGGLLLALFDRIPQEGDEVTAESDGGEVAHFTVTGMDNLRIDKIRVRLSSRESQ